MRKKLQHACDTDNADRVGGGMAWAAFEKWITSNPTRRSTGAVVRCGRQLFDPRLARAQMVADIARWRSVASRPVAVERQPVGRFFGRPRRRAKRTAATPTATADPDGEPASAHSDESAGES